jgi:signal transduction histidine kinase
MNPLWSRLLSAVLVSLLALNCAVCQELPLNVSVIRSLPRERLAQGLPVKIQGVVTFSVPEPRGNLVIFDGKESIFVSLDHDAVTQVIEHNQDNVHNFQPGTLIEVQGCTGAGDYAPVLYPQQIQILGTGKLPPYVPVSISELLSGSLDCQSVSVRGVIQRVEILKEKERVGQRLLVALQGGGHIICNCRCTPAQAAPLLDATVELRGVAFTYFNRRGQSIGARLELNGIEDITVLEAGPANPFDAPLVSMKDLGTFSPNLPTMHRQCIRGTVTFSQPGQFFYIQGQTRAVRVTTQQTNELSPGDVVEVSGFVEVPQYYAEIHEANFRKIGSSPVPAPVAVDQEKALAGPKPRHQLENLDLDGQLVQINGEIKQIVPQANGGHIMWVTQAGRTITAELGPDILPEDLAKWEPESQITVIGICVMTLNSAWPAMDHPEPSGFRILVRFPTDVVVLHPPPWWTPRRFFWVLILTFVVLVVALGWVWILRRAVIRQTQRLSVEIRARRDSEVEFKATTRERNRLAADLHDTLEQDLTATALQLEAARAFRNSSAEATAKHTELAYELLDRSRDDLRRSVWALRTGILEGRTFAEALRELANRTERLYNIPCECIIQDDGTRIPEFEANHLLLFVQEALANALKHANPSHLTIAILNEYKRILVSVTDDGSGFDVVNAAGPIQGHFGLLGMKERLNALGGTLVIRSNLGQGTCVEANVSLIRPLQTGA